MSKTRAEKEVIYKELTRKALEPIKNTDSDSEFPSMANALKKSMAMSWLRVAGRMAEAGLLDDEEDGGKDVS